MRVRNILILLAVLAVLAGVYLIVSRPEPEPTQTTTYVWDIDMDDIERIEISLPREGKSQAFIKIAEGDWRFADEQLSPVNPNRWGGGITLLLEGPAADRVITKNATKEQLATFGLDEPSMIITLTLADESTMIINVGDSTLSGDYYVRAPNSNAVALVDYYWYNVLKRLVTDPPYVTAEE